MKISNIRLAARSGLEKYLPDSSIIRSVYDLQVRNLNVSNEEAARIFSAICKSDSNSVKKTVFFKPIRQSIIGDKKTYKLCRKAYYKAKNVLHKEEKRLILRKREQSRNTDY
ncbi:MAG: hypothetical protein J6A52_03065 [Bacilli bacterium]|nr:hypothetical protein [Bacilli bacterium]